MGLSASQARLLFLTARLSDLELKAQMISNDKIRLSQQSEEISNKYLDALDKQQLNMQVGYNASAQNPVFREASVNLIMQSGMSGSSTLPQMILKNMNGKVVVSQKIADAFSANSSSLEGFLKAMGVGEGTVLASQVEALNKLQQTISSDPFNTSNTKDNLINIDCTAPGAINEKITTIRDAFSEYAAVLPEGSMKTNLQAFITMLDNLVSNCMSDNTGASQSDASKEGILGDQDIFKAVMTGTLGTASGISPADMEGVAGGAFAAFESINLSSIMEQLKAYQKANSDPAESYYTNIFKEMQVSGCYAETAENLASEDWLYGQLNNNTLSLEKYSSTANNGNGGFVSSSVSTDTSFVNTSDQTAISKATAEYNYEMGRINAKDKRYDLQLKNIDTEHNAVQTEVDSVKKVIDKNIERNFKIFDA